jgi:acetyl-CoA C-acetyltransferase
MLYFDTAQISAGKAMKQAGVILDAIDLFEYHDVFSIYAALQLEAVGFAIKGKGWRLAADGLIALGSGDPSGARHIPCATMGGMKARGFAGGASGVYQAVDAVTQLRGEGEANQITNAKTALIQSLGGPASTAVSHILQRV